MQYKHSCNISSQIHSRILLLNYVLIGPAGTEPISELLQTFQDSIGCRCCRNSVGVTTYPVRSRGGAGGVVHRRTHGESDAVAALLDQVDDVPVVQTVDLYVVHSEDPVPDLESSTAFCRGS